MCAKEPRPTGPGGLIYVRADCAECGKKMPYETDYYMVHDELWSSVAFEGELLHVHCLEKRLGRKLKREDFTECLVNEGYFGFDITRFDHA